MHESYFAAIQELADIARSEILQAKDLEDIRSMLSVFAIAKGIRTHAKFLINYSDEELLELEDRAFGPKN